MSAHAFLTHNIYSRAHTHSQLTQREYSFLFCSSFSQHIHTHNKVTTSYFILPFHIRPFNIHIYFSNSLVAHIHFHNSVHSFVHAYSRSHFSHTLTHPYAFMLIRISRRHNNEATAASLNMCCGMIITRCRLHSIDRLFLFDFVLKILGCVALFYEITSFQI